MKILLIYRHPEMGFSIEKAFKPVELRLRRLCETDVLHMPAFGYGPMALVKNVMFVRAAVHKKGYDIIHIVGTEHYLLPFLLSCKTVLTVFDLGFYTNHKRSPRRFFKYLLWIRTLRLADRVTFVSEKSLREAERLIGIPETKTCVIHPVCGDAFRFEAREFNADYPKVLHIGTKDNKNLERTAMALRGFPHHLRVIGVMTERQLQRLEACGTDFSNVHHLTDEQLLEEYRSCDIVNFPSLYEGFGMPILEGQAVGRLVITSDRTPLREVAGDGAVLVNPEDERSIRDGYREGIENRGRYIKAGLKNVERYRPEAAVRQYLALYASLGGDGDRPADGS